MIRLEGVSFSYGARRVLDHVDLALDKGDRVGLVGQNGSGKTTLCHIVMGLVKPDSGQVRVLGKMRTVEDDFAEIRGPVGFLFQDSDDQLFCPTVLEDVAFGPLNQGKSPDQAKQIVRQTLARLNLGGFEERLTYQLSGGEKRMVALATVLAMEPQVLLLDEPTSGLDEDTTERLVEVLTASDLTYLVVSHDTDFVARTCERVMELQGGKIREAS
ncbi:MAG: ABC transporter ATP-binding protein [Thermodesulfobacteriota bacterium]